MGCCFDISVQLGIGAHARCTERKLNNLQLPSIGKRLPPYLLCGMRPSPHGRMHYGRLVRATMRRCEFLAAILKREARKQRHQIPPWWSHETSSLDSSIIIKYFPLNHMRTRYQYTNLEGTLFPYLLPNKDDHYQYQFIETSLKKGTYTANS